MTTLAPPANRFSQIWPSPHVGEGVFILSRFRRTASQVTDRTWDQPVTRPPSFAIIEARKALAGLKLPVATAQSVERFLESVCAPDSTVPSITHGEDDGDALLHWIAGPLSMEVEVGPAGPTYFWSIDETGQQRASEGTPDEIEALAHRHVAAIATRANRANPDWRRQYRTPQ